MARTSRVNSGWHSQRDRKSRQAVGHAAQGPGSASVYLRGLRKEQASFKLFKLLPGCFRWACVCILPLFVLFSHFPQANAHPPLGCHFESRCTCLLVLLVTWPPLCTHLVKGTPRWLLPTVSPQTSWGDPRAAFLPTRKLVFVHWWNSASDFLG